MADPGRPDLPAAGLELCFFVGFRFPPPWFVPIEAPACGTVLRVPAEVTNDGLERTFVCDRPAGHSEDRPPVADRRHRQVTDNTIGTTVEWADGAAETGGYEVSHG